MRTLIPTKLCLRIAFFICSLWLLVATCLSEQLPVRRYTTADGLPRDRVTRIVQDSRGFIWLCTAEGLSRYDGYHFQNYGVTDGLPNRDVRDLKETRSGVYWIATSSGLAIFNPASINLQPAEPKPRFVPFVLDSARKDLFISKLFLDREDAIWCATNNGVYRIEHTNGEWRPVQIDFGLGLDPRDLDVHDVIEDQQGSIWCTTDAGIHQRDGHGHQTFYSTKDGLPSAAVRALVQDREGQFWAGTDNGLCRFTIAREGKTFNVTRNYTVADGLHSNSIWSILQTSDDRLWVATGGLNLWDPASPQNRPSFRAYTSAQGLKGTSVNSLAEDSDGNLWLGTEADGTEKVIRSGLTSYTTADGLSNDRIAAVFEDRNGILRVAVSRPDAMLNRFDGSHFTFSSTRLPAGARYSWGWHQIILQDRERDWWLATANGIYRYPSDRQGNPAMNMQPKAIYAKKDGLGADEVFRVFEDSRGDVWFGTLGNLDRSLGRWERISHTCHLYTPQADGVPVDSPSAFVESQNGDIWIGFYSGGVARYHNGHFSVFAGSSGVATGFVRELYFDSKQRLWISTSEGGVSRSDDPAREQPHFVTLTITDGLSSNQVTSVVEGGDGRFYIGTGRGIDQLDLDSGRIGHFTTTDGLPDSFINVSYRDHAGTLWFGTLHGLTRLVPGQREQKIHSQILITGLRAGNGPYQSADLGAVNISGLELGPGENRVQVDFVSPGFASGENLRYQYMLEGADRDWAAVTDQRSLNLANLAPGRYRLLARAVNSEGQVSLQPATISFRVLPPIWRRWWFIGLMIILVGTAVFGLGSVSRGADEGTARQRDALSHAGRDGFGCNHHD
jgi:ligand-binding sensor domain-containing protein